MQNMKNMFVSDIALNEKFISTFMIMKILNSKDKNINVYIGDRTGDIKCTLTNVKDLLKEGQVVKITGIKNENQIIQALEYELVNGFDLCDYLPTINKPLDEIMDEMDQITNKELISVQAKTLNDYFFKDEKFMKKFMHSIGGIKHHHNYIGGLAEHTLGVMYIAQNLANRYNCRYKEIAVLSAKLHDIGKVYEYDTSGPFYTTLAGETLGHIVIGLNMIQEAFLKFDYSEEFKLRILGCVAQHHGKMEYGSPKSPNTEESFIVHFSDYIDATLNKVGQVKDITNHGQISIYDRRVGTKLYC